MANVRPDVMAAVKRKLNVTWEDEGTEARLVDVVGIVSPRLASLLGYESSHEFTEADGGSWGLFLNGCLYEFSDAWDDFEANYATEIQSVRLWNIVHEKERAVDEEVDRLMDEVYQEVAANADP